jgi:hypothetical protein
MQCELFSFHRLSQSILEILVSAPLGERWEVSMALLDR